jgi:hypothetical protein
VLADEGRLGNGVGRERTCAREGFCKSVPEASVSRADIEHREIGAIRQPKMSLEEGQLQGRIHEIAADDPSTDPVGACAESAIFTEPRQDARGVRAHRVVGRKSQRPCGSPLPDPGCFTAKCLKRFVFEERGTPDRSIVLWGRH